MAKKTAVLVSGGGTNLQALIGKDQGPRLANFMKIIGKDELTKILSVY